MIGCGIILILNTLKFYKLSCSRPFEFLPDNLLKIKYFETDRKYVVIVDVKEFEMGEVIQLKVFNYEKFVIVFNIYGEEVYEELLEKCECEYEGCLDMECPFACKAFTLRNIF